MSTDLLQIYEPFQPFSVAGRTFPGKRFEEIVQRRLSASCSPTLPGGLPGRVTNSVEQSLESVEGSVIFRTFRSHLRNTINRMKHQEIIHAY